MRIALVIYGSLSTVSGGFLYDRKLVEALRIAGQEVTVVELPWRRYPQYLADNLSPSLARRLRATQADVWLQDELTHPSLVRANWSVAGTGERQIVSIVHHLRSSEEHARPLRPVYRAIERAYLHSVDRLVCNSRTTLAAVRRLVGDAKAALVLVPGADHLRYVVLQSLREVPEQPLRVAFVGNLIERKAVHTLIDAIALMRSPSLLDIVGDTQLDPAYSARLRRLVHRRGLGHRVRFLGAVNESALLRHYSDCHVLAAPSFEGFGIVYLEAMSMGRPVIASTSGAAREIVDDGVEGFLVPPNDPQSLAARLDSLALDRDRLLQMGDSARKRFERHPTWAEQGRRLNDWLEASAW